MPIAMVPSSVRALMSALSGAIGQAVDLDDNGALGLEFDDDVQLYIALATESQCLTVRSPLTHAGHEVTEAMCRAALALNYAHLPPGCQIALEDDTGQLVLMAVLAPDQVEPKVFIGWMDGFVQVIPELRARLRGQIVRAASDTAQFMSRGV